MDSFLKHKATIMREGGRRLAFVRDSLVEFAQLGVNFAEIDQKAFELIKSQGAKANFAMVPGYKWATCLMKNDEVCHGIPSAQKMIEPGDFIKIDVGLLYEGFHVDTTVSFYRGEVSEGTKNFLQHGQHALDRAIAEAIPGNTVYDISFQMEKTLTRHNLGAVYQLTGHGIGKQLHEDPNIPCFAQKRDKKEKLYEGQTVAIEVMYTQGNPDLKQDTDGWTFRTIDGSIGGMIEETVLVTANGPEILTRPIS
ncbi:type I methionyl aminopeptidase [Patescibacteria group bacterium]|nr:type I methionyl aminopeptidase [Patescibacteria group bacterium]